MPFDLSAVRERFPALAATDDGVRRIHFDNPAGTQVPASVVEAMSHCLLQANANLDGHFRTSHYVGAILDDARQAMADFVNAPSPSEIVFGQNMTTLTLHLSRSIGRLFSPGDEIIVSRMDHDANVWPWVLMARDLGLEVRWLPFNTTTFEFDPDALDKLLTERTRLVCVCGASNLTGTLNDVASLCASARAAGALTYIDAVQSAPHVVTDVQAIGCDFLVCSSYKFFGPHQGILWGRREVLERLEPYKVRPAKDAIPECFETGTQSHEGIAGITAAVNYFAWVGRTMADPAAADRRTQLVAAMTLLFDYEKTLARHLIDGLQSVDSVMVQGVTDPAALDRRVPTVSFTHERIAPAQIARALAAENIFVWSGHNYAVEIAGALGVLDKGGVVRVGPVHYNSCEEIDELITALERLPAA